MEQRSKEMHAIFIFIVGLVGWLVPGGGHLIIRENKHAIIIFITIVLTFITGLYIGSVAVIDPVGSKFWFMVQILNSPLVAVIGQIVVSQGYTVYGRPAELGQIYTSVAGLLNLLCIVNAVYWAHLRWNRTAEE